MTRRKTAAHPRKSREHWSVDAKNHLDHNKFHDNIYDLFPEKTIALMEKTVLATDAVKDRKRPWRG
jgi:hypothetical protein